VISVYTKDGGNNNLSVALRYVPLRLKSTDLMNRGRLSNVVPLSGSWSKSS
jgi:hypothetical protein